MAIPTFVLRILLVATTATALATYRGGEIRASTYAEWLEAEGVKDDPARRRGYLESLALAESLERAALAAGLDREPAGRARLAEAERDVLAQAFERQADQAIEVNASEVEAELQAEKAELNKPRRMRLRNIFKRVPESAGPARREAARAQMESLRQRLAAGADFGDAALHESDSQTRFQGGTMGAVPPGVLQPRIEKVAFALKEGELSSVIETPDGFTLLRCEGIVEARVMPLEEARQRIRQGLWTRKSTAARQALHAELQREAGLQDTIDAALATGRDDAVAGRFQGGSVTLAELRLLGPSSEAAAPEALRGRLQDLVRKTKLAERARQQHLDAEPKLRARVRWRRARVLATLEITREVNQVLVPPTSAELRAQFEAHRDRYEHPPEQDLSVIELPFAAPTGRQAFDSAEALAAQLRSGQREFSEAARSLSQHASAASGGRLGWMTNRQAAPFGPNVLRALGQASPGQIVGPVQQDDSLWILKLWERHAARPLSFEEASTRVDQELGNARVAEIQQRLEAAARQALDLHLLEATPAGP